MRILFLGNNRVAVEALKWLKQLNVEISGVVLHPEGKRRFADDLLTIAGLPEERILEAAQLRTPDSLRLIASWQPDLALSVFFGYILKRPFLEIFPEGTINLHPSFLPYNRGAHPNVWSIVDGTPAGVSLHYIDEGIDSGDLIAQQSVVVLPWDTGQTLYQKLETSAVELLQETWPAIEKRGVPRSPQPSGGTFHSSKDAGQLDCIDLNRQYTGRELIDILRARTFPPYRNAYFKHGDQRIYLRLELEPE